MTEPREPVNTKAAIKMRALRANPWHRKIVRAKADIKRLSILIAQYEVMRRQYPGITETQQSKTAGICYRNLLVQVVVYKYNFIARNQPQTDNV
jgi:hypothetical protein